MKNSYKKIISVVLTIIIILTAAPMSGFVGLKLNLDWLNFDWLNFSTKSSALDENGSCGENVTYTFDYSTGTLTISGTGDMYNYNDWDNYSPFYNNSSIKTIVVESGVTSIGKYSFYRCSELTRITLPETITDIDDDAFYNCYSLVNLSLPASLTRIGDSAFSYCSSIKYLNIRYNVTSIGSYAFYKCSSIATVLIGKRVTDIGECAFEYCTGLNSLTLGSSVKNIGSNAFYDCTGLSNITLPDSVKYIGSNAFDYTGYYNDTSNWENGILYINNYLIKATDSCSGEVLIKEGIKFIPDYAFSGCTGLTNVTIPDSVTSIGSSAFYGITGLTSVTIGNGVTSIGSQAFYDCTGLASVTIPDSVTSIYGFAFSGCSGLTSVTIGNSVTSISGGAFSGCTGLMSVTIPDSVTSIGYKAFNGCTGLISVIIGNSVTSIGEAAFSGCTGIKELTIPYSADFIYYYSSSYSGSGSYYVNNSFYNCSNIEKITFTTGSGSGYIRTGDYTPWYQSRNNLKTVVLQDGIISIDNSEFNYYTELTSITIPDSVTSIGHSAFNGCTGLTSVNISSIEAWCYISFYDYSSNPLYYAHNLYLNGELVTELIIPDSVTSIGSSAFSGCTGLTSVTIGNNVTSIGYGAFSGCTGMTTVNYNAVNCSSFGNSIFSGCSNFTSLNIGDNVISIPSYSFCDCTGLTSVTIENSVTSIDDAAFSGCTELTSIVIPDSVTSIGYEAFYNCTGLTSVTIGNGVTSIGDSAFSGCTGLASVTIGNSVTSIGNAAFSGCTELTSIVIPDSVKSISDFTFSRCTGLTSVTIPDSVTSFGYEAFYNCTGLTSLTLGNGVTSIGDYVFYGCTGLKELTMPCSVKIYSNTFAYCKNIETITLTKGTGTMQNYDDYSYSNVTNYEYTPWYISRESIRSLIIEDGVESIGSYAFYNCTGLTSVTIPDSVTSIGYYAFSGCTGLEELTIPCSAKIINYSFNCCANIETITLTKGTGIMQNYSSSSYYNTPWYISRNSLNNLIIENGVDNIGSYAFYNFTELTDLTIPDSVTSIGSYAFYNCTGFTSASIGSNVESIGNSAFSYCYGLTDVTIGSSVTTIGKYAFENCTGITSITIPDSVTSVGIRAFNGCRLSNVVIGNGLQSIPESVINKTYLESITIGNSVTKIADYAFYKCKLLTEITIPDSVSYIGDCAFNECSGLKTVELGNNPDLVINYNVFDGCDSVESYHVGNDSVNYWSDSFGVLYNKNRTGLIKYPAGNSRTEYTVERDVAYINENAFENSVYLKHVDLPNDIISIGEYAFYNCTALESIVIPDGTGTVCYSAFSGCTALTEITLPESLEVLGRKAFRNCVNVEKVNYNAKNLNEDEVRSTCFDNCGTESNGIDFVFGDTVENIPESLLDGYTYGSSQAPKVLSLTIGKNVKSISKYAFEGLSSLTVINFNAKKCELMNDAVWGCENLKTINLGDEVEIIPSNAFLNCNALTVLNIPGSVKSIGDFSFKECTNLQKIIFNSEDYINIGAGAFDECYNAVICCKENSYMHYYADRKGMQYCIIDEGGNPSFTVENDILVSYTGSGENIFVSSASKIGFAAFDGNETLKSVELASNVSRIYNQAFRNCSSLEKIVIPKSVTSIGSSAFSGCDNLTIWCYSGSYAQTFAENHDIPYTLIKLDLSQTSLTAADSETLSLTASFTTDLIDEDKITWTSSDTDVAVVENGIVNILDFGEVQITASTASGLSAECLISVDAKLKPGVDAEIDREENLLSGADIINKNPDEIKNMFANSNVEVSSETSKAGTGSTVTLYRANGGVFKEIEILIYGDVNSDGVYDGQDAFIVNCIANGMLTREQVGEAKFLAADSNHDGEVNSSDVLILEQAGLLLSKVEQAKDEEMKEQAFGEYLDLIDQNPEKETDPTEEDSAVISIFKYVVNLIKKCFDYIIRTFFPKV